MTTTPMFPLGTVLYPGLPLPLRLFEPRYLALIHDVLAGDGTFGVCLIERGSEVGGDDVRSGLGTMSRVLRAEEAPTGEWSVVTVGVHRLSVDEWLPDDPYPRADVRLDPDPEPHPEERSGFPDVLDRLEEAHALLDRGAQVPPNNAETLDAIASDPISASYQLCALAPVSTIDHQRLLAAPTVGVRLQLLDVLLQDAIAALRALRDT